MHAKRFLHVKTFFAHRKSYAIESEKIRCWTKNENSDSIVLSVAMNNKSARGEFPYFHEWTHLPSCSRFAGQSCSMLDFIIINDL